MRFFLPYMELLWKRFPAPLRDIKEAGFDGIECHLIGGLLKSHRVHRVREEAKSLGLSIRFHQGWSWKTGQRNLYNRILRPTGSLVPPDLTLRSQTLSACNDPVVVYGSRADASRRSNYLYQTASEHVDGARYAMSFDLFCARAKSGQLPLVFDTQHVLEWAAREENVAALPTDPALLAKAVLEQWSELGGQVAEIHLNDFDPKLGGSRGRNVFLGEGVFPLQEFCQAVKASGWDGVVTPEVNPQHLRGPVRLRKLHEKAVSLFS